MDPTIATAENDGRHLLYRAAAVLMAVVLVGTTGLMAIEGWDFWRAFFFTLITITTVGYGDEGISADGEKFATFLLIGGIGALSVTFGLFVQTMVMSPFAWKRRMQNSVEKLSHHVLVCGFGRMGRIVCEELSQEGKPFVVVERDPELVDQIRTLGYLVVPGEATEEETLAQAGIARASHLVAAIPSASENIVVTLTARELEPELPIISRAERTADVRKLGRAGATRVVSPFMSGGREVANAVLRPNVADFLARSARSHSGVVLAEIVVEQGSALVGCTLKDYGSADGSRISFVALEREGSEVQIPPRGTETLAAEDLLIVAGDASQVLSMRERARGKGRLAA